MLRFSPQGHDKPNFLAPTRPPSQMLMLCDSFQGFVSICLYPGLMEEAKLSILLWMSVVLQIGSYSYPVNVMEDSGRTEKLYDCCSFFQQL